MGKKDYDKQHYEKNKFEIQQRNKQPYECQCGCTIQRISDKARHFRSKKILCLHVCAPMQYYETTILYYACGHIIFICKQSNALNNM